LFVFFHNRIGGLLLLCFFLSSCALVRSIPKPTTIWQSRTKAEKASSTIVAASNEGATALYLDPVERQRTPAEIKLSSSPSRPALSTTQTVSSSSLLSTSALKTKEMATDLPETVIAQNASLLFKYAQLLEVDLQHLPDSLLLQQIDPWLGVRYRNGGNTNTGIDCSAFTATILSTYLGIRLPRTCREQYKFSERLPLTKLQAGDLLFFRTRGRSVSHVGIYLGNDKFVHASSSNGVMISDRKESYFSHRYVGAGRIAANTSFSENIF
jgi:cell wall-associated NlpC family hydrolase